MKQIGILHPKMGMHCLSGSDLIESVGWMVLLIVLSEPQLNVCLGPAEYLAKREAGGSLSQTSRKAGCSGLEVLKKRQDGLSLRVLAVMDLLGRKNFTHRL
jgi:hypothetical protein